MLNIDPFYFFLSFAIGIFVVYIVTPPPEIILKFPSPYNAGNILYKDKAQNCYKYHADKVTCPKEKMLIRPQPILEDYTNRIKQFSPLNAEKTENGN